MEPRSPNLPLRITALILTLLNSSFNVLYDKIGLGGRPIEEISHAYNNWFMPADYAFAIWGPIYLAFIIYAVIQVLPKQLGKPVYDWIGVPFVAANILCIVWEYVFRQGMLGLSAAVIFVTLACASTMAGRAWSAVRGGTYSYWLTVPFSLFYGWISVAFLSALSVFLVAGGYLAGAGLTDPQWTMVFCGLVFIIVLAVSLPSKDAIYAAVIAWAMFAVWTSYRSRSATAAQVALGVAIVALVCAAYGLSAFVRKQRAVM